MKGCDSPFWLLPIISCCFLIPVRSAQAQISSDGRLPTPTKVNTTDNLTFTITEGTRLGDNLFHSFDKFSVPTDGQAIFNNALDVQNIISRVTGGSISTIDGLLAAEGSTNLFLLNPNGIIFGSNASLNLGGSLIATTANSIKFVDGTEFSATNPSASLLTVSVPVGLQFGTSPGRIVNRSQAGQNLATGRAAGLEVNSGKTLTLVGGEVLLEGGNLTAPGGRVELGSVSNNSLVTLQSTNRGLTLNYQNVENFQDIHLSQAATIDVSDLGSIVTGIDIGSGDIQLQGSQITFTNGSQLTSTTTGKESAGTIAVKASDLIELIGTLANGLESTSLNTGTVGPGNAGNLSITTRRLIIRDGAGVTTSSFSTPFVITPTHGRSGNLTVNASESVEIIGSSSTVGASGLGVGTFTDGNAGNLQITTRELIIRDGATVTAASEGTGDAGNLTIATDNLRLRDGGEIRATSTQAGGGDIDITAEDIRLRDGSLISTSVFESIGGGGNITINSDVFIALEDSDILANAFDGRGGNIEIVSPVFLADLFSSGQATAVGRNPGSFEPFRGNDRVDISVEALGTSSTAASGSLSVSSLSLDQNSLSSLSTNFVPPEQVIADSCLTHRNKEQGSFIVTGTGGLPNNPYDPLQGRYSVTQVQGINGDAGQQATAPTVNSQSSTPSFWKPGDPIQEAQGMMVTSDGRVIVGTAPELVAIANADDLICYQAASQDE
ncbi:filamentous hemagglutinin N-terminal domain-containing protein [Coleofasciculus chthonoplastes]|jgi:filamentous hemagglutinin family protein|uniref:filamentous hemagglutinin N-terminal domain-containing protein n=1 Tax=Coleofasciculus chthonoplastes TaxID=64178 RepID=UPI0032FA4F4E